MNTDRDSASAFICVHLWFLFFLRKDRLKLRSMLPQQIDVFFWGVLGRVVGHLFGLIGRLLQCFDARVGLIDFGFSRRDRLFGLLFHLSLFVVGYGKIR